MLIGPESEQFRLIRNGFAFHELTHDELRAACLGLSTVLLHPGLNTVIDADHYWFWSWCGELFAGSRSTYFSVDEQELKDLFGLVVRASLAGVSGRRDQPASESATGVEQAMEPNAWLLGLKSKVVLAYLAFPLLEGLLKKECRAFVGQDGSVVTSFSVPRPSGNARTYQPGRTCSSIRDLLLLIRNQAATPELASDLDEQESHLRAFAKPNEDGFDVIYRWRNSSLHGAASFPTIGGTVLNTAILIALPALSSDYGALQTAALEQASWETQIESPIRSPWSYYPPYF
jgi:hypothetical protein